MTKWRTSSAVPQTPVPWTIVVPALGLSGLGHGDRHRCGLLILRSGQALCLQLVKLTVPSHESWTFLTINRPYGPVCEIL
jgi:hypothetical protein